MGITIYLYIFLGILLTAIFGRIITKHNFASSLLAGLLILSSIIAVTSRYIPIYNLLIIQTILLLGIVVFLHEFIKNYKSVKDILKNLSSKKNLLVILSIFLILIIYFINFHYQFFQFESHSLLYFSPTFEILKADYIGNLRVPTHYPSEFSSMHLIPSAAVATVGFLNPAPNLAFFTEIRYILIIIFFTNFIYSLYKTLNPSLWKLFFVCFLVFGIYGEEINYNLYVSSFIYVFVLLEIFLRILQINSERIEGNSQKEHSKDLLFFAIMLIICKAPIFYIAGIFAFYIWWKNKELRFHPITILVGILVLANMYSWLDMSFISTEAIKSASRFTLKGGFEFKELAGWSLQDSIKELIVLGDRGRKITGFLILFYILIKYYAVFLFIAFKDKKWHNLPIFDKSLVIYSIASLIGILTVRNDGGIGHQSHAYLLMSVLSFCALITFLLKTKLDKNIKLTLITIFIIFALSNKLGGLLLPNKSTYLVNNYGYLKYQDINSKYSGQKFYTINENEPYWKSRIYSQLLGLRIKGEDIQYMDHGAMTHFIIGAEKKIVDCPSIIEKCKTDKVFKQISQNQCNYCLKYSMGEKYYPSR